MHNVIRRSVKFNSLYLRHRTSLQCFSARTRQACTGPSSQGPIIPTVESLLQVHDLQRCRLGRGQETRKHEKERDETRNDGTTQETKRQNEKEGGRARKNETRLRQSEENRDRTRQTVKDIHKTIKNVTKRDATKQTQKEHNKTKNNET